MGTTNTATAATTKMITGLVRLSYVHIWEPRAAEGSENKKYSASLIIPKSDKATIKRIRECIEAAKEAGKAKLGGKVSANTKQPLRDGDEDRPDDPAYENSYFLSANSTKQPGVVDKNREELIDKDQLYSGCYAYASINFYAYNANNTSKGIACALNNLMKVKDGDRLDSVSSAADDFADVRVEDNDDLFD